MMMMMMMMLLLLLLMMMMMMMIDGFCNMCAVPVRIHVYTYAHDSFLRVRVYAHSHPPTHYQG